LKIDVHAGHSAVVVSPKFSEELYSTYLCLNMIQYRYCTGTVHNIISFVLSQLGADLAESSPLVAHKGNSNFLAHFLLFELFRYRSWFIGPCQSRLITYHPCRKVILTMTYGTGSAFVRVRLSDTDRVRYSFGRRRRRSKLQIPSISHGLGIIFVFSTLTKTSLEKRRESIEEERKRGSHQQ